MRWLWGRGRTSADVAYEQANSMLVEALPELGAAVQQALHDARPEEPGPHTLYDEALNPYIARLLDKTQETEEALTRVFAFVERLSESTDKNVREVVTDTILAALEREPRLARARPYMGPATRRLLKKVQR
jgi:hypothetical protein